MSLAVIAARWRVPISTTRVVPVRATAGQSTPQAGSSGDLLPDTTVKPRAPPSAVSGNAARPGTATALVTPGTTSTGTPASRQACTSSNPCANTKGSPPCSRTTTLPSRARSTRAASISSRLSRRPLGVRLASTISTCGPSRSSRPVGASRSTTTTSASSKRSRPRTVIRSGAPGPPPTSTTRPVIQERPRDRGRPCRSRPPSRTWRPRAGPAPRLCTRPRASAAPEPSPSRRSRSTSGRRPSVRSASVAPGSAERCPAIMAAVRIGSERRGDEGGGAGDHAVEDDRDAQRPPRRA